MALLSRLRSGLMQGFNRSSVLTTEAAAVFWSIVAVGRLRHVLVLFPQATFAPTNRKMRFCLLNIYGTRLHLWQ